MIFMLSMKIQKLVAKRFVFLPDDPLDSRELRIVKTREGNIVTGEIFKFDQSASGSYATDFGRLAEIDY